MQLSLAWNLLCKNKLDLNSQKHACFCLPSVWLKDTHHPMHLDVLLYIFSVKLLLKASKLAYSPPQF